MPDALMVLQHDSDQHVKQPATKSFFPDVADKLLHQR